MNIIFDIKILDEAHHITSDNIDYLDSDKKVFIKILSI